MKRRFRKEPKTLIEGQKRVGQLLRITPKYTGPLLRPSENAAIVQLRAFVGNGDGKGYHLIFPLSSGATAGEFAKGALRVLAPKARVTFLVTPELKYGREVDAESFNHLRKHLQKSINPNDERIRIIDDHLMGRTAYWIRKALEANKIDSKALANVTPVVESAHRLTPSEEADLHAHHTQAIRGILRQHIFSFEANWVKSPDGRHAMDFGKHVRLLREQGKDDKYAHLSEHDLVQHTKDHARERKAAYLLGIAYAKQFVSETQK